MDDYQEEVWESKIEDENISKITVWFYDIKQEKKRKRLGVRLPGVSHLFPPKDRVHYKKISQNYKIVLW